MSLKRPCMVLLLVLFALNACGSPAPVTAPPATALPVATVPPVPTPTAATQATAAPIAGGLTGTLRIGVAATLSGPLALTGQDQVNGIYIAEKYFNEHGGANGHPVHFALEDAGSDEASAVTTMRAFVDGGQVVGIIGPTLSQQAFAADPVANRAQIPVIGASNTAQGIPQIGEYVRRVSAPGVTTAPAVLRSALARTPTIHRVALFYAQNDSSSVSEIDVFQRTAESLKLNVMTVQKYQIADRDFRAQIAAALDMRPDLAIVSGLAADGGALVRQLRASGFNGTIIGGDGLNNTALYPACSAMCDGLLLAQAYTPTLENEAANALRTAYRTQFNKDPPTATAQAFTAVQVFVEALRSVDAKTPLHALSLSDLRIALNTQIQAGNYVTPLGEIRFDASHELVQRVFTTVQVRMNPDGSFSSLQPLP